MLLPDGISMALHLLQSFKENVNLNDQELLASIGAIARCTVGRVFNSLISSGRIRHV